MITKKKVYRYLKKWPAKFGWLHLVRWCNQLRYLFVKPYIKIESAMAIEGQGLYLAGWVLGKRGSVKQVWLSGAGESKRDITEQLIWQKDDELAKRYGTYRYRTSPRFIGFIRIPGFALEESQGRAKNIKLGFVLATGRTRIRAARIASTQQAPLKAIENLLGAVPLHAADKRYWFDQVYGPVVQSIWAGRMSPTTGADKVVYNPALASRSPAVSVIIPIYGRYDFIEYQLSEFVNDADMQNHEIIYVIDDPRLVTEIRESAKVLEKIYKISFSIVYLPENYGFAGASNQGARVAVSANLLMMNSDVMPANKGWLSRLLANAGEDIDKSITGVRLLYEDNAVQHRGMAFYASPFVNDLWTNTHPAKGIANDLVASKPHRYECEAVTGACLLLSKKNFLTLGGFDENYILGDYEDSDLCMKARRLGLRIVMDDQVVLYHLERQSQTMVSADQWKEQVTYYNCWLHTSKWDQDIRLLKSSLKQKEVVAHG